MHIMTYNEDYGRNRFKEVGVLSSMLPSYVRQCCRSMYDGTDNEVLDTNREIAFHVLAKFKRDYDFVDRHLFIIRAYTPEMVKEMIQANMPKLDSCMAIKTHQGLPKRACLHCPKMADWMRIMREYRTGENSDDYIGKKTKI